MCSFVTQHNATDVSSWGRVHLACWLQECPPELLPNNCVNFSTISRLQRHFSGIGSKSNQPHKTTCMVLCGRVVCWCQHCEQSAPWWRWVMVWAGISYGQWIQLHFINGLEALPHVARICTQFLEAVPVLPWPAYSPDMLPIEHVWDALDWHVRQQVPVPGNIQQLCTAIEEECDNILQATINSLINSMRRRCRIAWGKWWSLVDTDWFSDLRPYRFKGFCDQQMHICIPSHVKSID